MAMVCKWFILVCFFYIPWISAYQAMIEHNATTWQIAHDKEVNSVYQVSTIIDVLLLSYQIAKESCVMIFAKFIAQEELFKIYTPSLNDSLFENLQIERNNVTKLEEAINKMKESQNNFQKLCNMMKSLAPFIVKTNPELTQSLIVDLKNALIVWGKSQEDITNELVGVQGEFSLAISTISDIKMIFDSMFSSSEYKHAYLKEAAGCVSKTYKDIECVCAHFIKVRKDSIEQIQKFFKIFFKSYYKKLYEALSEEQKACISLISTSDQKLPDPDSFFV